MSVLKRFTLHITHCIISIDRPEYIKKSLSNCQTIEKKNKKKNRFQTNVKMKCLEAKKAL